MGSGIFYARAATTLKNVKKFRPWRNLFFVSILFFSIPFGSKAQTSPTFVSGTTVSLSVCENSTIDLSSYLNVNDPDLGQTENYTVTQAPTLTGSSFVGIPTSAPSGSTSITISGVFYTTGATGTEYIQVQVDDGAQLAHLGCFECVRRQQRVGGVLRLQVFQNHRAFA